MPNLAVFHAQPAGSMVCGAYALTAIGIAFGKLPATFDIELRRGPLAATIDKNQAGLAAAGAIYTITGVGPGGNNMPANMCYVALQLGLKPTAAFVKGCALMTHKVFGALFKGEQAACQTLDAGGSEDIWAAPKGGQAQAVCVYSGPGFHWLALGEDGKYMDPADGKVHAWSGKGYKEAGLWITFTT